MPKQQQSGSFRMTINQHELCGNLIDGEWVYASTAWPATFSRYDGRDPGDAIAAFVRKASAETPDKKSAGQKPSRCPGMGDSTSPVGDPCCGRIGEYNGYGSDGPTIFTCPKHCSCHD